MWRAGVIDCHRVQCSLVIDTQPLLPGIHISGAPHFLNRGPAWSKSGPTRSYTGVERRSGCIFHPHLSATPVRNKPTADLSNDDCLGRKLMIVRIARIELHSAELEFPGSVHCRCFRFSLKMKNRKCCINTRLLFQREIKKNYKSGHTLAELKLPPPGKRLHAQRQYFTINVVQNQRQIGRSR